MRRPWRRSALPAVALLLLSTLAGCGACGGRRFSSGYTMRVAEILDRVHKSYVGAMGACGRSVEACAVAGRELVSGAEAAKAEVSGLEAPEGAAPSPRRVVEALDRWVAVGEALEAIYWNRSPEGANQGMHDAMRAAEDALKLEATAFLASE